MSDKKILVILGHPDHESFCGAIMDFYVAGAKEGGHEVREIRLGQLNFDPILRHGYRAVQELEPDLKAAQQDILWANHIVLIFPTWWGSFPALLKGFFDRIILPGFGFKYHKNNPLWDRLLKGRSARLIVTLDSPCLFYYLTLGLAGIKIVKRAVFGFCGIGPIETTIFDKVRKTTETQRLVRLQKVTRLGRAGR